MQKQTKAVASGSTGLAEALAVALKLNAHKQLTKVANAGGRGAQVARTALAALDHTDDAKPYISGGGIKEMAKAIIKDAAEPRVLITRDTAPPFRKGGHGRDFGKMHVDEVPDPHKERLRREEQAKTINKHCAVIKREDPRLLVELLQAFGTVEGLSAPKQQDLIQRLERIRKEYRI